MTKSAQAADSIECGNSGTRVSVCIKELTLEGWSCWFGGLTVERKIVLYKCELYVSHQIKKWRLNTL